MLQFQRHFARGKAWEMEAMTSEGGSRSINYAFETVQLAPRSLLRTSGRRIAFVCILRGESGPAQRSTGPEVGRWIEDREWVCAKFPGQKEPTP